jgi:fermentation-respiration switch protein FrsA (DUF1100 family)
MRANHQGTVAFLKRHWFLEVFLVLALVFVMVPGNLERLFVYFPAGALQGDPSRIGLPYQDLSLVAEDGIRLHGWFVPHPAARCTFLLFHGNAGNISHRLPWIEMLHNLRANVFIIDYRGYGRSEGRPFEEGLYRDARAAYSWWDGNHPPQGNKLVLIGESLGGAVAVDLASRVPVDGLVLQSTFTSARDMAKTLFPIGLLLPLARIHFDSAAKIAAISCPKLVIHGNADEIVPFRLGKQLFDLAPPPKHFYEVPRAAHNDLLWVAGPEYISRLQAFLDVIESAPRPRSR